MEWRMLQRWWYTSMLTPTHAFMISSKWGNTWYHSSGPNIPTCIISVSLCKPCQSEVKTKSNCHFPHEQSETGFLNLIIILEFFRLNCIPNVNEWRNIFVSKLFVAKNWVPRSCFMVLSTFLSLWFIVTISTCDNTGLCGLWPTSVWLTDYSSYWVLISVPDRQYIFLLWSIISWGISGYWLKVYRLKRCWWYSFVNLEDAFDVADENFWWILDSIEIAIFWFSAFIIWFGKCY